MSKKFDPNVDLEKILPLTMRQLAAGLLAITLLLAMSCMFGATIFIPSFHRSDMGVGQWLALIIFTTVPLTGAVIAIISIIRRNVIGMECTVGITSVNGAVYHFHRPGLLMNSKQQPLIVYSHVRLGGWGNNERLFPIYCLGTDGEAEQPISPSLRVTAEGRFELVQMESKNRVGGPIYNLLVYAFHNAGGLDVFGAQTALNRSANELATLRCQLDSLGVPLVAIKHRLETLKPAYQSPHGEVTADLCHIALENIPEAMADEWLTKALERFSNYFQPWKKGQPKATPRRQTTSTQVTA